MKLAGAMPSLVVAAICFSVAACAGGPKLEEQKAQILDNKIHFKGLTSQAFLETWGKPTYTHRERVQFYTLEDGNSIPRFRVPLGELPQGWATAIIYDDSLFYGYADRGELLGFAEGRLVYREQLPAAEIHSIGKAWARDDLFKSRLEAPGAPAPMQ